MNHKHEALWPLKICTLYTLCTLILSNSLHLTIGSSLTLIQNELWVPKCCHVHSKILFLMLKFPKNVIKILVYCTSIIFVVHHFFGWKEVKSGSPIVRFHPFIKGCGSLIPFAKPTLVGDQLLHSLILSWIITYGFITLDPIT
jgi:hypothetical protein